MKPVQYSTVSLVHVMYVLYVCCTVYVHYVNNCWIVLRAS